METTQMIFYEELAGMINLQLRLDRIQQIINNFHNHFIFKDGVNFNFLFCLYSQKLKEIYNSIEKIDNQDFNQRIELLQNAIENIRPFILE
ncbi:MAG: hypothetical protein ACTSWL_04195 [Promethearchaeota archaeon]